MNCIELNDPFPLTKGEYRSDDLPHVGEIIHMMLVDLGVVRPSGGPPNCYQLEKGLVWERLLSLALPECADRPGELVVDGIIISPDGLKYWEVVEGVDGSVLELDTLVVEEYKCTARSSKLFPADELRWMMQTKAYCRGVGAHHCIFRILHLNGDYRDRNPAPKTWLVEFTQAELDENWSAILAYARGRGLIAGAGACE